MYARRIVVTGLGAVTPLGSNVETFWRELVAGRSGVGRIRNFSVGDFRPNYAAEVKDFAPESFGISKRKARFMGRHAQLALAAAIEANAHAKLNEASLTIERQRVGAMLGVGMLNPLAPDTGKIGCAFGAVKEEKLKETNARQLSENARTSSAEVRETEAENLFDLQTFGRVGVPQLFPLWLLRHIPNLTGGHLSIELDTQAALNAITNGCVSSASAVGEAARVIARREADAVLAGGTDARVNPLAMLRYRDLSWLAAKETDELQTLSASFCESACGFINGEGAGILTIEAEDVARARGAQIHAEILSYAAANDAHDALRPHAEGRALARAIAKCLRQAEVSPDDVDVVFAPANGIREFDAACANGLRTAFHARAKKITVTATRAAIGHTHAASVALDLIAAIKTIESGIAPPVLNLKNPIAEARGFDFIAGSAREIKAQIALVAAYGFGGHAAAILLRRREE